MSKIDYRSDFTKATHALADKFACQDRAVVCLMTYFVGHQDFNETYAIGPCPLEADPRYVELMQEIIRKKLGESRWVPTNDFKTFSVGPYSVLMLETPIVPDTDIHYYRNDSTWDDLEFLDVHAYMKTVDHDKLKLSSEMKAWLRPLIGTL